MVGAVSVALDASSRAGHSDRCCTALAAFLITIAPSVAGLVAASVSHLLEVQRGMRVVVHSSRRQLPTCRRALPGPANLLRIVLRRGHGRSRWCGASVASSADLSVAVPPGGFQRVGACLGGTSAASLRVAGRGLRSDLAVETMARRSLVWPGACRYWLPVWLPNLVSAANVRDFGKVTGRHYRGDQARTHWPKATRQPHTPTARQLSRGRLARRRRALNTWGVPVRGPVSTTVTITDMHDPAARSCRK
jgi:hypothetical protein